MFGNLQPTKQFIMAFDLVENNTAKWYLKSISVWPTLFFPHCIIWQGNEVLFCY